MALLLSQQGAAVDFPGEEYSPFVATFVAAVLTLTPVSEEFEGPTPVEDFGRSEVAAFAAFLPPLVIAQPSPNEEFGGEHRLKNLDQLVVFLVLRQSRVRYEE